MAPRIRIAATGVINASGGGGGRGYNAGGGGGGSGGMIGLDGADIQLAAGARLYANGGGGEGLGCGPELGPADGQNPSSPTVAAQGGRRDPRGGDGGNGAVAAGDGAQGFDGLLCPDARFLGSGGDGGDGAGVIVAHGAVADLGAQVSPPLAAL